MQCAESLVVLETVRAESLFFFFACNTTQFFPKGSTACYHLLQPPAQQGKTRGWAGQWHPTSAASHAHQQPWLLTAWKPLYEGLWPIAFTNSHSVKLWETPQDKAPAKYTYSRNIFFHLMATETIKSANNSVPESGKKQAKPFSFQSLKHNSWAENIANFYPTITFSLLLNLNLLQTATEILQRIDSIFKTQSPVPTWQTSYNR